jgi:hypothetical protein
MAFPSRGCTLLSNLRATPLLYGRTRTGQEMALGIAYKSTYQLFWLYRILLRFQSADICITVAHSRHVAKLKSVKSSAVISSSSNRFHFTGTAIGGKGN